MNLFDFLLKNPKPIEPELFRLNSLADEFQIDSSDRVTLIGKTGCGKTTVVEQLLNNQPGYVIVVDPKGECYWPGWKIAEKPLTGFCRIAAP